ncbi:hypothetical protein SAMN05421666_0410 [Roseovarius nanhaiticus]|uniref:Oligosaccharide repeat unit polymerase n=1 Tax=Roseovarius nanhaiticus TaxID=573024 RepID=A0A1N7EPT5_9RHOB|nr:hypothetical protein [Roseovarius nanhaiticus]SEK70014.1 hypothetical protein SAMN05216208_1725 [Roseovarius nanhaiticus]SIR89955.1 hypothetical protein SAMN05421666_0410 [Roseovarius nanhaiticus]
MSIFALGLFIVALAALFLGRFNTIYGAIFSVSTYHHSLILVPFLSEASNYSDWVKFSNPEISFALIIVLLGLTLSAVALQLYTKKDIVRLPAAATNTNSIPLKAFSTCALVIVILAFITAGGTLQLSKRDLIDSGASTIFLLQYPFIIIFLASVVARDRAALIISFAALFGLSILVVSRAVIVLPVVSAFFYLVYSRNLLSLLTPRRAAIIVLAVFFAIYGKYLAIGIRLGDFNALSLALRSTNPASLMEGLEGYAISSYIAEIINLKKPYDWIDSMDALFQFLVIPDLFGADASSFTTYLAENYRPDADYGLAYTYFGEGYAVGGQWGVFLWTIILIAMLIATHQVLSKSRNLWFLAWACFAMSVLCFYFPRNSLEVNLTMLRLSGLSALILAVSAWTAKRVIADSNKRVNVPEIDLK